MIELRYNLTQSDFDNYDFAQVMETTELRFYASCNNLSESGYLPFSPIQRMGSNWYQQWIRFN